MLFNSYPFLLVFLPITVLGFFLIGSRSPRIACLWLVVASATFYAHWHFKSLLLLAISIGINLLIGGRITMHLAKGEAGRARARLYLVLGLSVNLLLLGYVKYAVFLLEQWNVIFSADLHIRQPRLPLGISFFTFTQIIYLVDCFRRHVKDSDPVRYALFVTYFPHLIAGPLLHHGQVMPQFQQRETFIFHNRNLELGLAIFGIGLFKKVVIADGLAPYADAVFNASRAGTVLTFAEAWLGALAYTMQLYFDFSGYSDMAIGLSTMFGIVIPANFLSPYKARSIIEFWRRWHISLSQFLRDYLYIPLGGNRLGRVRRYINLMLTMLLGGLWHGAAWTFVLWGGIHGLYLLLNHWFRQWRPAKGADDPQSKVSSTLSWLLTFTAIVVAWVPFRSSTLASATSMLQSMAGLHIPFSSGSEAVLTSQVANQLADWSTGLGWIGAAAFIALVLPNTMEFAVRFRPALIDEALLKTYGWLGSRLTWRPTTGWAIAMGGILALSAMGIGLQGSSPFLYFQF